MVQQRRKSSDHVEAQVALEELRGDRTVQEIAARPGPLPTRKSTRNTQVPDDLPDVFAGNPSLSLAGHRHRPPESGLIRRHHLRACH